MKRIAILGAGAMGAALTTPLTQNGLEVHLWGTELDTALLATMRDGQAHPRIGVPVNSRVQLYDPEELASALLDADSVVLAITSDGVVSILERAVPYLRPGQPIVMVTKGFGYDATGSINLIPPLLRSSLPPSLRDSCPIIAVGGPCKANEVAANWPTATIYGSSDAHALQHCQTLFQTASYRIELTDDVIGLEVAAALKNVYAIALGICNGLEEASRHPWHNLKAATFTRAVHEMVVFAEAMGGRSTTVLGLAGIGDLEVTGLSGRNHVLGERLGRGESIIEALETMRRLEQVVEGVAAARFAVELLEQLISEGRTASDAYPLLHAISAVLGGASDISERISEAVLSTPSPVPSTSS